MMVVNQQRTNCGIKWRWLYFVLAVAISHTSGTETSNDEWWQRTVFYQIYPRSFMDSNGDGVGDLRGISSRLVHLKDAGIGATWLSPIFLSPMVDFGYDITDYTAIQPEYGTMEDFAALLAEAERLGIKIILDFVPNHTSDQCEWFQRSVAREAPYTDYYVWHDGRVDPSSSNGTRLPPNNWPEDYDMVYQWRKLLDDWTRDYGGDSRIIMTEAYANITFTMKYYRSGEENQPRQGSHMPFNFLLITDLNRDSTAQDFVFTINKWLTYMPRTGATANWVLGNHDQRRVGTRYGAERIDAIHTLLLTLPGIAVTYYGEEIGMLDNPDAISSNGTGDSVTGGDAFIVFSRDPERTPFQWDDTANAGFSTGPTTWLPVHPNYRQLNLAAEKRSERSHYKTYQALVRLRTHATFRKGSIQLVPYSDSVIVYVRELQDADTFVVVINLSDGADRMVDLASVFPRLSPELTVASSGSESNYRTGDIVQSDRLIVGRYEGLVLQGVPLTSRTRDRDAMPSTNLAVLWRTVKDAAVIASIIIALGSSYYGLQPWHTIGKWTARGSLKK
ncbi:maltase 2-like isoform X2 [Anopheles funestus]|uniref:maltase 2-like isoform X2 n=1 Tax=Anopheles funestus TaxID=62324 RepID=UPI0020C6503B|nr:maltase 2-like isoform X2 [Anopheles funestus]